MSRNLFYVSTVVRHLWIILLVVAFTNAIVEVTPREIIAAVGTDVRINCTVNSNETVIWETTPFGKTRPQPVYDGKKFLDHFSESGRFTSDNSSRPGSHDLLISKIESSDAGSFSCIESTNQHQYCDLIVTDEIACAEKDPASRRMGENEFGIRQSILEFECKLNFSGNKRPVFCWFLNDDPMPGISTSLIADNNSTIASGELNNVVAVKNLNSTVVAVNVVIISNTDSDQCGFNSTNVRWKSKPLDIKFAALANRPVKECPDVDSSLLCNPLCTHEQHPRDDGSCYCQTNYTLEEKNYYLQVNSTRCGSDYHTGKLTAVVIASAIIAVAILLWHFKSEVIWLCGLIMNRMISFIRNDPMRVDGQPNAAQLPLKSNDNPTQE